MDEQRKAAWVEAGARAIFEASGTARYQTWERYKAFYKERGVLSPDYYAQARACITAFLAAAERDGAILTTLQGEMPATDRAGRWWISDRETADDHRRKGHNACRAAVLAGKVTL